MKGFGGELRRISRAPTFKAVVALLVVVVVAVTGLFISNNSAQAKTEPNTQAQIVAWTTDYDGKPDGEDTTPRTYVMHKMINDYIAAHSDEVILKSLKNSWDDDYKFEYLSDGLKTGKPNSAFPDYDLDGKCTYVGFKDGAKSGRFIIRYKNIGKTSDNVDVDMVFFVNVSQDSSGTEWIFRASDEDAGRIKYHGSSSTVTQSVTVRFYEAGSFSCNADGTYTGNEKKAVFGVDFGDVDMPVEEIQIHKNKFVADDGKVWAAIGEALPATTGHVNQAGNSRDGEILDCSINGDWYRFASSHQCGGPAIGGTDKPIGSDSALSFVVPSGLTFRWIGAGCATSMDLFVGKISNGDITVQKSSANPAATNGNSHYSLEGAEFKVYTSRDNANSDTNSKATLVTNAAGTTQAASLPAGTYYIKETKASPGYNKNSEVFEVVLKAGDHKTQPISEPPKYGYCDVQKSSERPAITNGNSLYSLKGATFGVYETQANANANSNSLGTLTTDDSGKTNKVGLPSGRYYVKETKASPGYAMDTSVHVVDVVTDKTATVPVYEPPKADDVTVSVAKLAAKAGENYNMSGARFKIEYYNAHLNAAQVAATTATRTWYVDTQHKSTNLGVGDLTHNMTSNSGDIYTRTDTSNVPVVPLGTIAVTEIIPTPGFALGSPKTVIYQVKDDGSDTSVGASRSNVQYYTANSGYTVSVSNVLAPASTNEPDKPVKKVDKAIAEVDDTVTYTVTQKVTNRPSGHTDWYWKNAKFIDTLPKYESYSQGSFKVLDTNGRDVTGQGSLSVTTVGDNRNKLEFTFDDNWLKSGLDYNGKDLTFIFSATVLDPQHQSGMYSLINDAITEVGSNSFKTNEVTTKVPVWWIDLIKKSSNPTISDANPSAYTLAGAQFSVTRTSDGYQPGTITTNEEGKGSLRVVKSGTYNVAETVAPKGYSLSKEVSSLTLSAANENYTERVTVNRKNDPLYVERLAQKVDADFWRMGTTVEEVERYGGVVGDNGLRQGNVPDFSGMEVRARYFGNFNWTAPHKAEAFWTSDKSGLVNMPANSPSSGSWPYQMNGKNVIPLGTFEWVETKAPVGMSVDDTPIRLTVKQVGDEAVVEVK